MAVIIDEGGASDRNSIPLVCRNGRCIRNLKRLDAPPDRMKVAVQNILTTFREAKLRSATQIYNCIGMVFASRRTWIIDDIEPILEADDYIQVQGLDRIQVGDLVLYGRPADIRHVGMVVSKEPNVYNGSWNIHVMSQWGADGEYLHPLDHVPGLYGTPLEFWTDRKDVAR